MLVRMNSSFSLDSSIKYHKCLTFGSMLRGRSNRRKFARHASRKQVISKIINSLAVSLSDSVLLTFVL